MEYCPIRNKSTLEITAHYDGIIALSRCSYLKNVIKMTHKEFLNVDFMSSELEDFWKQKSSPLCSVKCKYLDSKIENIIVGISKACNLNCYHCFNEGHHTDVLSEKQIYFTILEKVKGHKLNSLLLGSQGEVFVYYDKIVEYLKSLSTDDFKTVILQTNATLLSDDRVQELSEISKATGIKYQFFVSFSGITKESYEKTQVGAIFENTLNNLSSLLTTFGKNNIKITFIIKRTNILDAPHVVDFFKSLGIDFIDISYDLYDFGCKEVYNTLLKGPIGKYIYDTCKKENNICSDHLKKQKFVKDDNISNLEIKKIYENSINPINNLFKKKSSSVRVKDDTYSDLLTIGITLHGDEILSSNMANAIKENNKIHWILSNDKKSKRFDELKQSSTLENVEFFYAEPGIENNRQNILNHTNTKYIYIIDYDDEIHIDQNSLLNFLEKTNSEIIKVNPTEDGKDVNYIYYNDSTIFVTTWAQIFKTSFMKRLGGYIQTWNSYHEEFGTNANMLANIYKEDIYYEIDEIKKEYLTYNHLLDLNKKHNSFQTNKIKDYCAFIKHIPKNDRIQHKKEFIEFFKMRLNLMNLAEEDYDLLLKNFKRISK